MELQAFKDALSVAATGQTAAQAQEKGLCIQCKEPALPKCYSDAGIREYHISGMCEKCFDNMFAEEDDELTVHELTELQHAEIGEGPWKLYIFGEDGFHSGGKWFRKGPMQYPDEEISREDAKFKAEQSIAKGLEVRICDGGDNLVFHSEGGLILYPNSAEEFWGAI